MMLDIIITFLSVLTDVPKATISQAMAFRDTVHLMLLVSQGIAMTSGSSTTVGMM